MRIETKYDIGDKVWFIEENKIHNEKIKVITLKVSSNGSISVEYTLKKRLRIFPFAFTLMFKNEKDCFATKEDLVNNLLTSYLNEKSK